MSDRLSALPENLIHHILSFLELKDVITTSSLSSSWRFLWTTMTNIDLGRWYWDEGQEEEEEEEVFDTAKLITFSLLQYNAAKIQSFAAHFHFEIVAEQDITSWLGFAKKRNVFKLDLSLFQSTWMPIFVRQPRYKMSEYQLDLQFLEILRLEFFDLGTCSPSLNLPRLRVLELRHVLLSLLDTSRCPLLEVLILEDCNSEKILNIHAPNGNLKYLKIVDIHASTGDPDAFVDSAAAAADDEDEEEDNDTYYHNSVTLYAPYLQSIDFRGCLRKTYTIKNLSALRSAIFEFDGMDEFEAKPVVTKSLLNLLKLVRHAPTLRLCQQSIKILSFWEGKGEILPPFNAAHLQLSTNLTKSEFLGIACVLRSTQNLNSLILDISANPLSTGFWSRFRFCNLPGDSWELLVSVFDTMRLKMVKVNNVFATKSFILQKVPEHSLGIDEFLNKWEEEIKLMRALIDKCRMLEKMTVRATKVPCEALKVELPRALYERLISYLRQESHRKNLELIIE